MRWLFRFSVYFIRPLLCWYIAGYFGYLSIKAVASSVVSYQRSVEKAERQAAAQRHKLIGSSSDFDTATEGSGNVIQCHTNGVAPARRRSGKKGVAE